MPVPCYRLILDMVKCREQIMGWFMLWVKIMQNWLARVFTKIESAYDEHPMETCVATVGVIFLFVVLVLIF